MKKLPIIFFWAIISSIFFSVQAFCAGAGSSTGLGLSFEQMVSARAAGMAQAATAVEGDVNLIHYNPATIAIINSKEVGFTGLMGFTDMYLINIAYAKPFYGGVVAGSLSYFNGGNITLSLSDGTDKLYSTAQTDLIIKAVYAKELIENLPVAASVKIYTSSLLDDTFRAAALAFDFGVIYRTPIKNLKAGVSLQNVGSKIKYYQTDENLPMALRIGGSYPIDLDYGMLLFTNVDFNYLINDGKLVTGIGGEFKYNDIFTFRGGYVLGNALGLTFGAGFTFRGYIIDYAWELAPEVASLGNHKVGLRIAL